MVMFRVILVCFIVCHKVTIFFLIQQLLAAEILIITLELLFMFVFLLKVAAILPDVRTHGHVKVLS